MHLRDLTTLPVGLMLFFSFLFRPGRAALPVFPRLARHAGDHEARPPRVAVVCQAVGTDKARNPFATWYAKMAERRFSAPETATIQVELSGSAGIGTTAPGATLDVEGTGYILDSRFGALSGALVLATAGGTQASPTAIITTENSGIILFKGYDGTAYDYNAGIYAGVDGSISTGIIPGNLQLYTAGPTGVNAERMRINSSGNVGIGLTTSINDKLDVAGGIGLTTTTATLPVNGMYSPSANALVFSTSSSAALTITSTGSVGVSLYGPTSPQRSTWRGAVRRRRVPATRRRRADGRQNSRNTGGGMVHALDLGDCFGVYPRQRGIEVRSSLLLR
jgi:hypothetical protein